MTTINTGRVTITSETLAAGGVFTFADFASAAPATLAVHPAAGATALIEVCADTPAAIAAGTALWAPAALGESGVVNVATIVDIPSPLTAIRVTATNGGVQVRVVQ